MSGLRRVPVAASTRVSAVRTDGDRGSLTLFVAVVAVALLGVAGLVVDGGGKLRAARLATSYAEGAARAAAQGMDVARARGGEVGVLDQRAAIAAADAYLASAGVAGGASPLGSHQISVSVTVNRPTEMLSLVGVNSWTVHGQATADLQTGG